MQKREPPPLLLVEYLHAHGLYMIMPVLGNRPCQQEYMFSNYLDAKQFIDSWQINATATHFAYEIKERNMI